MSIHHTVTIHCDSCCHWEHGGDLGDTMNRSPRERKRRGWIVYREGRHLRHKCPSCAKAAENGNRDEV